MREMQVYFSSNKIQNKVERSQKSAALAGNLQRCPKTQSKTAERPRDQFKEKAMFSVERG